MSKCFTIMALNVCVRDATTAIYRLPIIIHPSHSSDTIGPWAQPGRQNEGAPLQEQQVMHHDDASHESYHVPPAQSLFYINDEGLATALPLGSLGVHGQHTHAVFHEP
jgi:hypothetical protein